jgi:hypothetical protein
MSLELLIPRAPEDGHSQAGCKLLDSFAIVIQICLATIAFSTLIIKRQRENPQRPVRIWQVTEHVDQKSLYEQRTNMMIWLIVGLLMLANKL